MSLLTYFKDFILKFRSNDGHEKKVLDHYFFDLKYYLKKYAGIKYLSNILNISTQKLDQITIENCDCSYELLITEYKYRQFLEELESLINSNLTVEPILKFSGFKDNVKFVDFVKSKQSA
jgi:hypothetical protein